MSFRSASWVRSTAADAGRSITVDGYVIADDAVMINSRGVLALVEGNPRTDDHKTVPFRLLLKRDGMIIRRWPATDEPTTYSIRLDELWPVARPGDQLLVKPTCGAEQPIRIIRVQTINWLPLLRSKTDAGC